MGGELAAGGDMEGSQYDYSAAPGVHLEQGADVRQRGQYGSALQAAGPEGHDMIVRLLRERARMSMRNETVHPAPFGGHNLVVRLLLHKEESMNTQGARQRIAGRDVGGPRSDLAPGAAREQKPMLVEESMAVHCKQRHMKVTM
jgi:hypothetical protein